MRTKTLFISCLWFLLSVVLTPKTTEACSCSNQMLSDREDAARQFEEAAVVFEGEVIPGGSEIVAASRDKMGLSVTVFRVIRSYKGERAESIQLFDAMAGTDCALGPPPAGEKYLVYGFQGQDGKIYYHACSRTGRLESAGSDLRYARGEPATKEDLNPPGEKWRLLRDPSLATRGATLRGNVRRLDAGEVNDVFLTVWGVDEKGRRENWIAATQKVNPDSSYEVRFLAHGHYMVTAEDMRMTPTTRFVGEYGNIALAEGQTLVAVDVILHPDPLGKVAIQVNAPAELHDRLFVWLRDVEMDSVGSAPYHYAQTANLNEKNVASFEYVPYGRYDVYVSLTEEDSTKPSWTHDKIQVQLNGNKAET
ncbi:MAG: hypothetical protein ACHQKY_18605, partial [Terriglobia bacterium]